MRPNSHYCRFVKADTKLLGYTSLTQQALRKGTDQFLLRAGDLAFPDFFPSCQSMPQHKEDWKQKGKVLSAEGFNLYYSSTSLSHSCSQRQASVRVPPALILPVTTKEDRKASSLLLYLLRSHR